MKILMIAKSEHSLTYDFVQKIYSDGYYIIKIVHTPADAVLSMRQIAPDVVILDIDFLMETGESLILEQVYNYNNIPVIYVTDESVKHILDKTLDQQSFGYVSYNCTKEELSAALDRAYSKINLVEKTAAQSNMMNVLMENSSMGIIFLDKTGRIVKHNRQFFDIFRAEPNLDSIENISGGRINTEMVERLLAGEKQDLIKLNIKGVKKYLHISAEKCKWYHNELIMMFISDMTNLYKTQHSLEESEMRFAKVFSERSDPGVIVKCSTCEIYAANKAFAEKYKVDPKQCTGSTLVTYIGNEVSNIVKLRAHGKDSFSLNRIQQQSFAGDTFIVNFKGKKISFDNNDYFFMEIRDVTEQVKAEEAKKMFQQHLMHANKLTALGTLVSCMAHEINNPNNFIMFNTSLVSDYIDIMAGKKEDDGEEPMSQEDIQNDLRELVDGIAKGAERIKFIVDDLKSYARAGQVSVFQKVCLKEAAETSVRLLSHKIRKATKRFKATFPEGSFFIYGNQQKLEQVIMNILMNSIEAIKSTDCLLEVKCYNDVNYQIIEIIDEGVGIAEENLGKLLDPFFSTKFQNGGTGLGLYIANSIIKEHRGFLNIRSRVSIGTTVTIKFPKYAHA